jgi:hypothetical protein
MTKTQQPEETPAVPVKFLGMSSAVENPPKLGETQEFLVTARCIGDGRDERQSGGIVEFRKMRVLDVKPGKITPAPEEEPGLFSGDGTPSLGSGDEDEAGA